MSDNERGRGGPEGQAAPFVFGKGASCGANHNAGRVYSVVGAGPGGLAAATILAQQGARVTLFERAPEIADIGAGIQLSPNAMAVLQALGVDGRAAHPVDAVTLVNGRTGARVAGVDLAGAGYEYPYLAWHRADLIAALVAAARAAGVKIATGQEVVGAHVDADKAMLRLHSGEVVESDALVGADGLQSRLRHLLLQGGAPRFTGHVAWRATVPLDPAAPDMAQVWMLPGRHAVTYPLRARGLLNIVAVEARHAWAAEGWSHPDDPAALRDGFANAAPQLRACLDQVETCFLWGLFRHRPPRAWHRGRAVLIGDAVHPTLPFLAQGAAMALEDAWSMARITAASPGLAQALAAFSDARRARVRRTVGAANANARLYHLAPPLAGLAHGMMRALDRLAPNAARARFDWLYRHDPTA